MILINKLEEKRLLQESFVLTNNVILVNDDVNKNNSHKHIVSNNDN